MAPSVMLPSPAYFLLSLLVSIFYLYGNCELGFFPPVFMFSSWLLLGDEKVVHFPSGLLRSAFPIVPKMCHFTPASPSKHIEVFQSATCFSLIFDSDSELQFDEPHQLLGILFRIQLTQRVNCCTDVWCGKFYDV